MMVSIGKRAGAHGVNADNWEIYCCAAAKHSIYSHNIITSFQAQELGGNFTQRALNSNRKRQQLVASDTRALWQQHASISYHANEVSLVTRHIPQLRLSTSAFDALHYHCSSVGKQAKCISSSLEIYAEKCTIIMKWGYRVAGVQVSSVSVGNRAALVDGLQQPMVKMHIILSGMPLSLSASGTWI